MSDPFVAEIRMFTFTFNPPGWAWCDGQLMPISQNTALFALLGTVYGGDGKSTFALPDLQDAAPMQPDTSRGQGPGLSSHSLGEQSGTPFVTLLTSEMPAHTHAVHASSFPGDIQTPTPNTSLARSTGGNAYQTTTNANLVQMSASTFPPAGGSLPHNNLMPYGTLLFSIALQGTFPPRG